MGAPVRVIENRMFVVHESDPRERAVASFRATRRRVRARGLADTVADAVMATGGLVLANAGLHFGLGLPQGRNGIALGGTLLASGMVWLTRHLRAGGHHKDPAASAARPVLLWSADEDGVRSAA